MKSGFGGFGYGFGKVSPSLRKVFESSFGGGKPKLKPEQEALVKKFASEITEELEQHIEGNEFGPGSENSIMDMLRELLHASEAAEGEDPKELDQGGPPSGMKLPLGMKKGMKK